MERKRGGLGAVGGVGLGEDVTDMVRHGVATNEQRLCNLTIAFASNEKTQDFHLTFAQPAGVLMADTSL